MCKTNKIHYLCLLRQEKQLLTKVQHSNSKTISCVAAIEVLMCVRAFVTTSSLHPQKRDQLRLKMNCWEKRGCWLHGRRCDGVGVVSMLYHE